MFGRAVWIVLTVTSLGGTFEGVVRLASVLLSEVALRPADGTNQPCKSRFLSGVSFRANVDSSAKSGSSALWCHPVSSEERVRVGVGLPFTDP